jgi:hypothetical protein
MRVAIVVIPSLRLFAEDYDPNALMVRYRGSAQNVFGKETWIPACAGMTTIAIRQ